MPFLYRCSECRAKIRSSDGSAPTMCPACGVRVASDRPDDEVVMPAFLSAKTKSNDKLLRDMQSGAQARAEMAAEAVGVPASEMKDMVPSNFNTRRDAEIMAMPVSNLVTHHMDAMKARGQGIGFANGAAYAANAGAGQVIHDGKVVGRQAPRAGAMIQSQLQRHFGR